jgi:hypothetical protein
MIISIEMKKIRIKLVKVKCTFLHPTLAPNLHRKPEEYKPVTLEGYTTPGLYLVADKSTDIFGKISQIFTKNQYGHIGLAIIDEQPTEDIPTFMSSERAGVRVYDIGIDECDIQRINWIYYPENIIKYFKSVEGTAGSLTKDIGQPKRADQLSIGNLEFVTKALGLAYPERWNMHEILRVSKCLSTPHSEVL